MLWAPPTAPIGTQSAFHNAATVTASPGVTISLPSSANTKSGWVEVTSATAGEVIEVELCAIGTTSSGNNSCTLLDLGIGPSGSEVVLVADMPVGFTNSQGSGIPGMIRIPAYIPAGTRVAVRAQSQRTSANINVPVLFTYGPRVPGMSFLGTSFTTYGAQSGSSNGVLVEPEIGAANEDGFPVQVTASTSRAHRGFLLLSQGYGLTSGGAASLNAHGYVLSLAVGVNVLGTVHIRTSTAEVRQGPWPSGPIWRSVPAGTELSVWCRCSASGGQAIDAIVIGIS